MKAIKHSTNTVKQSPQIRTCLFGSKHQTRLFLRKSLPDPSASEGAVLNGPLHHDQTQLGPTLGTSASSPGDNRRKDGTINPINQQKQLAHCLLQYTAQPPSELKTSDICSECQEQRKEMRQVSNAVNHPYGPHNSKQRPQAQLL